MSYAVAVDIGGTFTDLVAFDQEAGSVAYAKAPTSYENFVAGILSCFEKARVGLVSHGTTLVINALIQRRGARAALVTTKGFRDLLEIARGNRANPLDLHYRRDEPLIPRERRFEVAERLDATGAVRTALDRDGLRLRHGFEQLVADREFIAETEKVRLPLAPKTGAELQAIIAQTFAISPGALARVNELSQP